MSLRARLIVAMAVVAMVLVLAAFAITTTTEKHLLRQLDDRLSEVAQRGGRPEPPGGGFEGRYSSFYVGVVDGEGDVQSFQRPVSRSGFEAAPNLPIKKIDAIPEGQQGFFSVGSNGGPHYRILAVRTGNGAVIFGTARDDVD